MPLNYVAAWELRGVGLIAFFVVWVLSFFSAYKRHHPEINLAFSAFIGMLIIVMLIVSSPSETAYQIYAIGTLFSVMLSMITKASLLLIAVVSFSLTLSYLIVGILVQQLHLSDETRTFSGVLVVFLIGLNALSLMLSYIIRKSERNSFLQRQLINRQHKEAEALRQQADVLLFNMLPQNIALSLKNKQSRIADYHENVSVLFADLVNFTPLSASLTPIELVELLNEVFTCFDGLVEKYKLEKIKTIGDCYMVAAGIPEARADHALAITSLALEIQQIAASRLFGERQLSFRIGIHSGPVIAGVIGNKKFSYDLWGDVVNTASRMESQGREGTVQITEATYQLVKNDFVCEEQEPISVKGKGTMKVWHVQSLR